MKTYRVTLNNDQSRPSGWQKVTVTEEGAKLIYAAYIKLYGNCQDMDRREARGGIAYESEIQHWIDQGALPKDFNWKQYIVQP